MNCRGCVHINKERKSKCELLTNKDVSFYCHCERWDYDNRLVEMLGYYTKKFVESNDVMERKKYLAHIRKVTKELDI